VSAATGDTDAPYPLPPAISLAAPSLFFPPLLHLALAPRPFEARSSQGLYIVALGAEAHGDRQVEPRWVAGACTTQRAR